MAPRLCRALAAVWVEPHRQGQEVASLLDSLDATLKEKHDWHWRKEGSHTTPACQPPEQLCGKLHVESA